MDTRVTWKFLSLWLVWIELYTGKFLSLGLAGIKVVYTWKSLNWVLFGFKYSQERNRSEHLEVSILDLI
jgi:hypothetical protein